MATSDWAATGGGVELPGRGSSGNRGSPSRAAARRGGFFQGQFDFITRGNARHLLDQQAGDGSRPIAGEFGDHLAETAFARRLRQEGGFVVHAETFGFIRKEIHFARRSRSGPFHHEGAGVLGRGFLPMGRGGKLGGRLGQALLRHLQGGHLGGGLFLGADDQIGLHLGLAQQTGSFAFLPVYLGRYVQRARGHRRSNREGDQEDDRVGIFVASEFIQQMLFRHRPLDFAGGDSRRELPLDFGGHPGARIPPVSVPLGLHFQPEAGQHGGTRAGGVGGQNESGGGMLGPGRRQHSPQHQNSTDYEPNPSHEP